MRKGSPKEETIEMFSGARKVRLFRLVPYHYSGKDYFIDSFESAKDRLSWCLAFLAIYKLICIINYAKFILEEIKKYLDP